MTISQVITRIPSGCAEIQGQLTYVSDVPPFVVLIFTKASNDNCGVNRGFGFSNVGKYGWNNFDISAK